MTRAVLVAALLLIAPAALAQDWIEYRPAGLPYRVEMPATPGVETEVTKDDVLGTIAETRATARHDGRDYSVSHTIFEKAKIAQIQNFNVEEMLDRSRDGAVAEIENGKLRSEKRIVIGGKPARDVVIQSNDVWVRMRIWFVDHVLIAALIDGPAGSENSPAARRFMESLALTKP